MLTLQIINKPIINIKNEVSYREDRIVFKKMITKRLTLLLCFSALLNGCTTLEKKAGQINPDFFHKKTHYSKSLILENLTRYATYHGTHVEATPITKALIYKSFDDQKIINAFDDGRSHIILEFQAADDEKDVDINHWNVQVFQNGNTVHFKSRILKIDKIYYESYSATSEPGMFIGDIYFPGSTNIYPVTTSNYKGRSIIIIGKDQHFDMSKPFEIHLKKKRASERTSPLVFLWT